MSTAIAKTLLDTRELRAGSVITETEIAALRLRWRPYGRARLTREKHGRPSPWKEYCELRACLPMRISDEQGKKGLDWLRKMFFDKKGQLRHTRWVDDQNIGESHAEVVRTLDHFLLVAFEFESNACGLMWPFPVYRAVSSSGAFFDYVAKAWQSGECTVFEVDAEYRE